jgi:hypothetical protein
LPIPINTCVSSIKVATSTRGAPIVIVFALDRIEHPASDEQQNADRIPHLYELAVRSPRNVVNHSLASKTRIPRIMDFQLLPDMGRMNGQWPRIARSLVVFDPTGARICSLLFGRLLVPPRVAVSTPIKPLWPFCEGAQC